MPHEHDRLLLRSDRRPVAPASGRPGTHSRLPRPRRQPRRPLEHFDVDKAWHAIHVLLTGEPWEGDPPLNFIVIGGHELGEDLGYGPARAFPAAEAGAISAAIDAITPDHLRVRFDRAAMAASEIYPSIWEDEDEEFDDFFDAYAALKEWLRGVASRNNGFVTYIG